MKPIKLIKSTFYQERLTKKKLAGFIMRAQQMSMSEQCRTFEQSFAKKQGRRHAVFVASGSAANLILMQSLLNLERLEKGDRVGVSALTWATNVMPIIQLGLEPVVIDCSRDTLNVSVKELAKAGPIKALFLTNVLGFCDDLPAIEKWCAKKKILLLEDNCESLGSKMAGRLLGNFSRAATFSFFVGHHLSTIEGGMVATDDAKLYEMLLMVRAHGWDRDLGPARQRQLRAVRKVDAFFARYTFWELAYNARPTEINGFLGNLQLPYWDEIVERRQDNFLKFKTAIENNPELVSLDWPQLELVSNFAMPVLASSRQLFEKYRRKFTRAGVEIRPIVAGDITKQPFYRKFSRSGAGRSRANRKRQCRSAALIHRQGFYFPNNPELTKAEIKRLCELVSK